MTTQRVLVCEDSRVYAVGLSRMLEHDGDITVTEVCSTASEAIAALPRVKPDLMTIDLELPGMDGLKAIAEIMSSRPMPILVLSSHVEAGSEKTAAALAAGALDAIAKNDLDLRDPASPAGAAFRRRVRVLCRAQVIRHLRATLKIGASPPGLARRASVIGICASTGGPQVLARLLEALPAGYPIPIMIVQHIGARFTGELARWLDMSVQVPVALASAGRPAGPGAWIAPEGAHLKLTEAGMLSLDRRTIVGHHRPSGDVLLKSIAAIAGRAGVAVVLTGMGSDGAAGAAAVRDRGGFVIAQDEKSSAVYGMPKAALDLGVDAVLSPTEIASYLLGLSHQPFPVLR